MKKTSILKLCLIAIITFPIFVSALEEDLSVVTKYYKTTIILNEKNTIDINNFSNTENNIVKSYTKEISYDEYENANDINIITPFDYSNGKIETNYKKMTSSITKNGSNYRYKVVLEWQTMPSIRSYDIIGIGFKSSVKPKSSLVFSQYYCLSNGNCNTSTSHTSYLGTNGIGASFALPIGKLTALKQTIYADMIKSNNSSTIISQSANGDYSHAIKNISYDNSKKYTVSNLGIELKSAVTNYYDEINTANAKWTGTW